MYFHLLERLQPTPRLCRPVEQCPLPEHLLPSAPPCSLAPHVPVPGHTTPSSLLFDLSLPASHLSLGAFFPLMQVSV